jgi:hypothetical protein
LAVEGGSTTYPFHSGKREYSVAGNREIFDEDWARMCVRGTENFVMLVLTTQGNRKAEALGQSTTWTWEGGKLQGSDANDEPFREGKQKRRSSRSDGAADGSLGGIGEALLLLD